MFPLIVALNRTDNLLAHERFGQHREEAPRAITDTDEGLDTQQKNLKKAKKFGLKMIPSVRKLDTSTAKADGETRDGSTGVVMSGVAVQSENHKPEPHTVHSESLKYGNEAVSKSESRSTTPIPRLASDDGSGITPRSHTDTPIPRPRSRYHSPSPLDSPCHTTGPPVPLARRKRSDPYHLTPSDSTPLLFSSEESELPIPHFQLPVEDTKTSPDGDLISSSSSSLESNFQPPVPKPRKASYPSTNTLAPIDSRAEIRVPLVSQSSHEVSLDFFPGSPVHRGREAIIGDSGESVLDFVPNGRTQLVPIEPDYPAPVSAERVARLPFSPDPPSEIMAEGLYTGLPSMGDNLTRLRQRANSKDSLIDEGIDTRRYSGHSTCSDCSIADQPPRVSQNFITLLKCLYCSSYSNSF